MYLFTFLNDSLSYNKQENCSVLQLSIVSKHSGKPGYVAVGGVYMTHDYCSTKPFSAQKGSVSLICFCNWIFLDQDSAGASQ